MHRSGWVNARSGWGNARSRWGSARIDQSGDPVVYFRCRYFCISAWKVATTDAEAHYAHLSECRTLQQRSARVALAGIPSRQKGTHHGLWIQARICTSTLLVAVHGQSNSLNRSLTGPSKDVVPQPIVNTEVPGKRSTLRRGNGTNARSVTGVLSRSTIAS